MTKLQLVKARDKFIIWAQLNGWKFDRWNHLRKQIGDKFYRFKLSRIAVRYEVKIAGGWVRIKSAYFSKLSIVDGKLIGLKR